MHGDAEINMTEFDPRRFGKFADETYVRDKVFQDYRLTFTTRKPGEEEMAARPGRKARCTKGSRHRVVYTPRHSAGNARSGSPSMAAARTTLMRATTFSRSSAMKSRPCMNAWDSRSDRIF